MKTKSKSKGKNAVAEVVGQVASEIAGESGTSTTSCSAVKVDVKPSGRIIGIAHRVKKKKDGEASPTIISILDMNNGGSVQTFKLETEQEELDFMNGICPVKWRPVDIGEDISATPDYQVIWRSAKDEDVLVESRHKSQCRHETKKGKKGAPDTVTLVEVAEEIPCEFIGVERGDTIAMCLGGSGDYFAFALTRKMGEIGGMVIRVPAHKLKDYRKGGDKKDDSTLIAHMAVDKFDDFYLSQVRDAKIIRLRNAFRDRTDCMKARIACEQRLRQRHIGLIFCSEEGKFPEGDIKKSFEERAANDDVLKNLLLEEARAEKEMERCVEDTEVWQKVFADIKGIGPCIAAKLICSVIDVRRFDKPSKFVKFLGAHVRLKDEKTGEALKKELQFPRRRAGMLSNWSPDGRQALWQITDQFNRQGESTYWGKYLLEQKRKFREKHPVEELTEGGKKRYTKGHIHKMALWRTATRFATRLYKDWSKLEKSATKASSQE